jgi:hypothetical protein
LRQAIGLPIHHRTDLFINQKHLLLTKRFLIRGEMTLLKNVKSYLATHVTKHDKRTRTPTQFTAIYTPLEKDMKIARSIFFGILMAGCNSI